MKKFLMVAALVASSASAWAHDHQGTNGGRVEDAGSYHVELVSKSEKVDLYISDANQKPIAATGFKAIGIFVVNGKAQRDCDGTCRKRAAFRNRQRCAVGAAEGGGATDLTRWQNRASQIQLKLRGASRTDADRNSIQFRD